jgi:hypothetical protein
MGARRRRINKELVGGPAPADEESGPSKYARRGGANASHESTRTDTPPLFITLSWILVAFAVVFALGRLVFASW